MNSERTSKPGQKEATGYGDIKQVLQQTMEQDHRRDRVLGSVPQQQEPQGLPQHVLGRHNQQMRAEAGLSSFPVAYHQAQSRRGEGLIEHYPHQYGLPATVPAGFRVSEGRHVVPFHPLG